MTYIAVQSPSFTGRRVLRAVPDGKGGTDMAVRRGVMGSSKRAPTRAERDEEAIAAALKGEK